MKPLAQGALAGVIAAIAGILVVSVGSLAMGETALHTYFIVGYGLIGALVGAASAWFSRSVVAAVTISVGVLLLMHLPDVPHNLGNAAAQLVASLVGAAVGIVGVRSRARGSRAGQDV